MSAPEIPDATAPRPPALTLLAVGLLAGATLGLQVAFTRHFSFLYWHHFAFMIIGIGMLGFGAAGAWLARRGGVEPGADGLRLAARAAVAAALCAALHLAIAPFFRFAPLALLDDPRQFFVLLGLYAMMLMPFASLGLAQAAVLAGHRAWAHRVYAADLLGAGLGCLATLGVLAVLSAPAAVLAWGTCAALAGALLGRGVGTRTATGALAVCGVLVALLALGWADERPFRPAPSKDMSFLYFTPSGRPRPEPLLERTVSSATLRLDVSKPLVVPFGFGGNVAGPRRARQAKARIVYQDAAAPTLIYALDPERAPFLGRTSQGLAYQIREKPRVLVIGAGGGPDVMIALHHGAESVTAVELNPQMMELGRVHYANFNKGIYHRENVRPIVSEGRHFLGRNRETFDLIQMSGVDTFAALASGAYAMSENYLYTVEAVEAILNALEPDGLFTNSRWYLAPPRETLRLVAVMQEALRRDGAADPSRHLFVMKADTWATALLSRRPFSEAELATLRAWTAEHGWRVVLDPNGSGARPFVEWVHGSGAERAAFFDAYPYEVKPVSDDNPFFFQFYRWRNLLDPPRSRGGHSITRIPVGYAVLAASLVQMTLLAALCIFGPLWSARSRLRGTPRLARRFAFFAAVGFGFMTLEITSLQLFTVFLGHPIYSMAVTLASLLVATGLGSAWAGRRSAAPARIVASALGALSVWVGATVLALGPLLDLVVGWPLLGRALLVAAWLTPAGLALGMPFPTAIRALQAETPALVPWAWGANACLSVIASLASVLVAMQVGFRVTLVLAVALYWAGYWAWRSTLEPSPSWTTRPVRTSASDTDARNSMPPTRTR